MIIPLKALSVNAAWQGRRFKTKNYQQFERDMFMLMPKRKQTKGFVELHFKFYLTNYGMTDVSNLIKCTEDIIVKAGWIEDDRKVVKLTAEKIRAEENGIEIHINETK